MRSYELLMTIRPPLLFNAITKLENASIIRRLREINYYRFEGTLQGILLE